MKIISYSPGVTRELAAVLAAAPDLPAALAERTLVAADGYWQPGDWHKDLARAVRAGHPLSAVGFRQEPGERTLASRDWADIARRLLSRGDWQHMPWVAVRTGPQSMVVVAATGQRMRPAMVHEFADSVGRAFGRPEPAAQPDAGPRPMRILDACHTDRDVLAVLVDHRPDVADLLFTPHLVHDGLPASRHPAPRTLYIGHHPDGYVVDLFDSGDGRGFHGEPLDLRLADGTVRTVVGPYSSRDPARVVRYVPEVFLGRVCLHVDPRKFQERPDSGVAAMLTNPTAQRALFKAARHITQTNPAALAKTSYPTEQPAGDRPPDVPGSGPPTHTTPRRSVR